MSILRTLLQQSKWRVFNIDVAKALGLNETLVLMELSDAEAHFKKDWFYLTYQKISNNTTLSEYLIRNVVKRLRELGVIETKMKGQPAKQVYKINGKVIEDILMSRPPKFDRAENDSDAPPKSDMSRPPKSDMSRPPKFDRAIIKKEPIKKKPIKKEAELKNSTPTLFGEEDNKAKKTLFRNSNVKEFDIFKKKLHDAVDSGIDILYYFNAVKDWSDLSNTKRTGIGWTATARSFMRGDKQSNKLVLIKSSSDIEKQNKEMLEYLKM